MSRTNKERLDSALKRFRSHPVISEFRRFMVEAPDSELFHIDPARLADAWHVERRTVLELLLRAVRFGLLSMEWVFHCPTCGGVAKESLQLAHTHEQDFCPVCKVDFRNTLDENVEVSFSVSPEIRAATVLFSDVTGSTAMYERLGDARSGRALHGRGIHPGAGSETSSQGASFPGKTRGGVDERNRKARPGISSGSAVNRAHSLPGSMSRRRFSPCHAAAAVIS